MVPIDWSHESHITLDKYPTIHHFVTEKCTRVIMGYGTGTMWDLWNRSTDDALQEIGKPYIRIDSLRPTDAT